MDPKVRFGTYANIFSVLYTPVPEALWSMSGHVLAGLTQALGMWLLYGLCTYYGKRLPRTLGNQAGYTNGPGSIQTTEVALHVVKRELDVANVTIQKYKSDRDRWAILAQDLERQKVAVGEQVAELEQEVAELREASDEEDGESSGSGNDSGFDEPEDMDR